MNKDIFHQDYKKPIVQIFGRIGHPSQSYLRTMPNTQSYFNMGENGPLQFTRIPLSTPCLDCVHIPKAENNEYLVTVVQRGEQSIPNNLQDGPFVILPGSRVTPSYTDQPDLLIQPLFDTLGHSSASSTLPSVAPVDADPLAFLSSLESTAKPMEASLDLPGLPPSSSMYSFPPYWEGLLLKQSELRLCK